MAIDPGHADHPPPRSELSEAVEVKLLLPGRVFFLPPPREPLLHLFPPAAGNCGILLSSLVPQLPPLPRADIAVRRGGERFRRGGGGGGTADGDAERRGE